MTRRVPRGGIDAMLNQGLEAAQEQAREPTRPPAEEPPRPRRTPPEKRERFGTRLKPSLHVFLEKEVLRLKEELGHRVSMEDIVEALMLELQADAGLRERVLARVARE